MWARIDKGTVVELTDVDPSGRFNPSLVWVKCPDNTAQGMAYTGGRFEAAAIDLDWLAAEARGQRDKLLRDYDAMIIEAKREERMGVDVIQRITDLDAYAVALLGVPQQAGFPEVIAWPVAPQKPNNEQEQ